MTFNWPPKEKDRKLLENGHQKSNSTVLTKSEASIFMSLWNEMALMKKFKSYSQTKIFDSLHLNSNT